jgi:hypothetical protein
MDSQDKEEFRLWQPRIGRAIVPPPWQAAMRKIMKLPEARPAARPLAVR